MCTTELAYGHKINEWMINYAQMVTVCGQMFGLCLGFECDYLQYFCFPHVLMCYYT